MAARTKARKRALDILFEADQKGSNVLDVLDARLKDSGREMPLPPYAEQIVRGVVQWWVELNSIIQDASPEWQLTRMPAVDRALLRIGAWEILCNDEVDLAVAIDEAVSLAGDLSTDDSPSFVNGVLGAIGRDAPALTHRED
ncbi:transcription antitermination factor NusB [Demequina mangrovi]|uniref:Transcription antitermination protein NusB n=1 Tax=Demequina mangrovi TaxID=1043493 RepID=A0A1H6U6E9_9MICO|nr:transcription antitermination factor NusB [Demequina mangrovi]SEI86134.1 NusB antitermination factor [Demequina mangrovi]